MKFLLLFILATSFAHSGEAEKPEISDPAIAVYEKAVAEADAKALVEKRKARDEAVKALDNLIKETMRAGILDKAIALKSAKDKISKEWLPGDGGLIGEKALHGESLNHTILTTNIWTMPLAQNRQITFNVNGSFTSEVRSNGKWRLKDNNVLMNWDDGGRQVWPIINGVLIQDGTSPCGKFPVK